MRNYDLVSTAQKGMPDHGLVSPKWYQTDIDRKTLKHLLLRDDAPAIRDIIIFYGLMAGFGLWVRERAGDLHVHMPECISITL